MRNFFPPFSYLLERCAYFVSVECVVFVVASLSVARFARQKMSVASSVAAVDAFAASVAAVSTW